MTRLIVLVLFAGLPQVVRAQDGDGVIILHARNAQVHGTQLRYEPQPNKNTLGYWTRAEDYATWEFTVKKPGAFSVELLQGCGKDQGGSEVEVTVDKQTLKHTVKDTGGWQAFESLSIGSIKIEKEGKYTLTVKPKSKKGVAVMDLRSVTLRPRS